MALLVDRPHDNHLTRRAPVSGSGAIGDGEVQPKSDLGVRIPD